MRIFQTYFNLVWAFVLSMVFSDISVVFGADLSKGHAHVDTVYYNGTIYTMTETPHEASDMRAARKVEVVATRDGLIAFAGSKTEAVKRGYFRTARTTVDLMGKTMLPGFVDGHGHFPEQGQYDLYEINLNSSPLGTMTSIADYQKALGARCEKALPGEWVMGWGYDDTSITDLRHPTREDIDAVCPDNPVYLRHISGHMGVANSKALRLAGITPDEPEKFQTTGVVKDSRGQATGLLMETKAMGLITSLAAFPQADPQRCLARANHVYAAAGVTTADQGASMIAAHLPLFQKGLFLKHLSLRVVLHPLAVYELVTPQGVHDAAGWVNRAALGWKQVSGSLRSDSGTFLFADPAQAVQTGGDITRLPVAVYSMDQRTGEPFQETTLSVPENLPSDMLFLGAWKLLFDGSIQGYTAWLKAPGYYNWGRYTAADSFDGAPFFNGASGTLNIAAPYLEQLVHLYHQAGQSTETHVNGNAAAEAWVAAMEKAVVAVPNMEDTRHTAIHAQMIELQHIQRMTGNYAALEGTAYLYSGLDGAFRDGRLNPEAVGAPDIETLSRLMKKQHLFNSYFIDHVYFWGDRHRNIFMGPGRANNMSPAGWSVYYNQPYAFHSDTFVTPVHPLRSVQTAVTRTSAATPLSKGGVLISGSGRNIRATVQFPARDPAEVKGASNVGVFPNYDQRINVLQALLGVTRLPAWQNKLDERIGSVREGLAADFVILAQDPLLVAEKDAQKLAAIRVMATIVSDQPVFGFLPGTRVLAAPPVPSYVWNNSAELPVLDSTAIKTVGRTFSLSHRQEKQLAAYTVSATLNDCETTVFQMDFLGNNGTVADMRLYRATESGELVPFSYSVEGPLLNGEAAVKSQSGKDTLSEQARSNTFWIASLKEPTRILEKSDILKMDESYLVFFRLKADSAQEHHRNTQSCAVTVLLATTGNLPSNAGTTPGV